MITVHNERTASIFSVIDDLSRHMKKDNLRFVLSARQPEFGRFVQDRLGIIPVPIRNSINKLVNRSNIQVKIEPFVEGDVIGFIGKYKDETEIIKLTKRLGFQTPDLEGHKKLMEIASRIYTETKGDPILVKFFLFGKGLASDVKRRYDEYLSDNEDKLTTALICSILNRASLPITRTITDCCNITKFGTGINWSCYFIFRRYKGLENNTSSLGFGISHLSVNQ